MVKNLVFTLCFISLFSCGNKKQTSNYQPIPEIAFLKEEHPIKASAIASEMRFVTLEKTDQSLIGDIRKMEIEENHIYISDNVFNGVYVFDFQGRYIKSLHKEGRGAGEYLSMDDFVVDSVSGTIEVLDRLNMSIFIYSLDSFDFRSSIKIPFSFCFSFVKKNHIYYFQTNNARNIIEGKDTNSEIIAYNSKSEKATPLFNTILPDSENQAWEFFNVFATNKSGEIFVSLAWHDKQYQVEGTSVSAIFSIEKGSRGYPDKILKSSYSERMDFLQSGAKNKIHFFKLLMNEPDRIILGYGIGYPPQVCYYIATNDGRPPVYTHNIINDFVSFKQEKINIFKEDDGYLLSVIYPYEERENAELLRRFGVSEHDNPIILFFKI